MRNSKYYPQSATLSLVPKNEELDSPLVYALKNSAQTLTMYIDLARIATLLAPDQSITQELVKEIKLWRSYLNHRLLSSIELNYLPSAVELHELTILIHHIANCFDIGDANYRVVLNARDAHPSALALLKGLGFKVCQFIFDPHNQVGIKQLQQGFANARAYGFEKIGIQIRDVNDVQSLSATVHDLSNQFTPHYVFIGASSAQLCTTQIKDKTTLFEDDISPLQADVFGLGPGSINRFSGYTLNGLTSAQSYIRSIEKNLLPLNHPEFQSVELMPTPQCVKK